MSVSLQVFNKKHIDEVLEIEAVSFTTPWSREAFEQEIENNDLATYLVALNFNKVVGYAGMWIIIDEAHITNVAVHPTYRGKGFGRLLMEGMMAEARFKGAKRMTLEVRTSNQIAQKLYESLGFISCGIRKGYYTDTKEDAMIMWNELGKDLKLDGDY